MQTRRRTLSAFSTPLLMGAAAPAAQAAVQPAAGTFIVEPPTVGPVRQVGRTCFLELDATFVFSGTLQGAAPIHFSIVQRAPCTAAGPQTFTATGTFTGTAAGAPGGFDLVFHGQIDAAGHARGQLVIVGGTGGQAGLHGRLTLTGQAGVGGTYEGTLTSAS